MLKCKELSRLPKAASGKYVNFRRQTPGCTTDHFKPGNALRSDCLDPSHPATSVPRSQFPNIRSDILGIKAIPFAILTKPEQVWTTPSHSPIDTWTERVQRLLHTNANLETGEDPLEVAPILLNNARENAIPMSFVNATSKKRTSNKKHIRDRIVTRLKVAINLIVARGADVAQVNGKPKLVMNETEAEKMSDKWVFPGWTYIFFPTLEIYRMPYHDMIPMLRESLQQIYDLSQNFEKKWAASATTPKKTSPTRYSHSTPILVQALHQHPGKTTPRKPSQNRGPRQTAYRAYSTRSHPTTYPKSKSAKGSFDTKPPRERNGNVSKKSKKSKSPWSHILNESELSEHLSQPNKFDKISTWAELEECFETSHRSEFDATAEPEATPTVRIGDVVFNIPRHSPIPANDSPKIIPAVREDDPSFKVLREFRDGATQLLGRSTKLQGSKLKREFTRRRVAVQEAQRREPLGLEFIGFDSRPNPSYDPFTDVEPSSRPEEGPTPARKELIDLLNTRSARMSPRTPAMAEAGDLEFPHSPSEYPRFDIFAPLIHTEERKPASAILTESADKSSGGSSGPLDFKDFASLESAPASSTPESKSEVELTSPNVLPGQARSVEDLIQAFDPFDPEETDGSLIITPTTPTEEKKPASAILTESADKSPASSSSPVDFDDLAPPEPTPMSSALEPKPKAELTPPEVSPADTQSIQDAIEAFDPFHPEDSDGSLITTTMTPVSQPGPSPPPSTSTKDCKKERPVDTISRQHGSRDYNSATRVQTVKRKLFQAKPILIPRRVVRRK